MNGLNDNIPDSGVREIAVSRFTLNTEQAGRRVYHGRQCDMQRWAPVAIFKPQLGYH